MPTLESWLALNAAELPSRSSIALLDNFGSPDAIFTTHPDELASVGRLRPPERFRLAVAAKKDFAKQAVRLQELNTRLITIQDADYPANLRQIPDPPIVLFLRGSLQQLDERCVAVVGTRRVTPYGRLFSETLARDLAVRGVTVVSGLAVGADAAAHLGAMKAGGRTIGVLACGIDVPYPKETMEIRERIVTQGAVISELPLGTTPRRSRFAARNRLVSGLALAVVVTEAPQRSGALITASMAGEQGRHVFAVPGSINSEFSKGTHALLRDGATLVQNVEDILEDLSLSDLAPQTIRTNESLPEPKNLNAEEGVILHALSLQQRHVDEIIEECCIPASRANAGLLMLELKGLVRRLPGNMFIRVR